MWFLCGILAVTLLLFLIHVLFYFMNDVINEQIQFFDKVDCVVLHIYALSRKGGKIPARGKAAAKAAAALSARLKLPLIIIPTGFASSQPVSDAVIYEQFIRQFEIGKYLEIIHGSNLLACTTHDEVVEAVRIMSSQSWHRALAVGIHAHLVRINHYWRGMSGEIEVSFHGVSCEVKNYPWELANVILEAILPAGTKRRKIVLWLAKRGRRREP